LSLFQCPAPPLSLLRSLGEVQPFLLLLVSFNAHRRFFPVVFSLSFLPSKSFKRSHNILLRGPTGFPAICLLSFFPSTFSFDRGRPAAKVRVGWTSPPACSFFYPSRDCWFFSHLCSSFSHLLLSSCRWSISLLSILLPAFSSHPCINVLSPQALLFLLILLTPKLPLPPPLVTVFRNFCGPKKTSFLSPFPTHLSLSTSLIGSILLWVGLQPCFFIAFFFTLPPPPVMGFLLGHKLYSFRWPRRVTFPLTCLFRFPSLLSPVLSFCTCATFSQVVRPFSLSPRVVQNQCLFANLGFPTDFFSVFVTLFFFGWGPF